MSEFERIVNEYAAKVRATEEPGDESSARALEAYMIDVQAAQARIAGCAADVIEGI